MGRPVTWPKNLKIFPISFTREVYKFYALADTFVFPTIYEPFGLVLFEAMAMGLAIITKRSQVGASELLEGLPEVYFADQAGFNFPNDKLKDPESKKILRAARLNKLGDVSWQKAGIELNAYLGNIQ